MAKAFAFSYSKLKNYETCPFKYLKVDVQKEFKEESDQLVWGNKVHSAMAECVLKGTPLPADMKPWQHWADGVRALPGETLVEQKYALTRDFQPTEYFGPRVWYRGIADAVKIDGNRAGVFDWKTGKVKHDSVQLMLSTACVFAYHPEVEQIRTSFIWLQEDDVTSDDFSRQAIVEAWPAVLERVAELEASHAQMKFPPKPGGLCMQYCPVNVCEFWKKGTSR